MPKANKNNNCAKCRRAAEKLFLKGEKCFTAKCPLVQRNYPPGQHGPTQRVRLTGYGEQLKEKQKAKRVYGLRERQFANYVTKASTHKGNTSDTLLSFLEMRLDNVVYRLGLSKSRDAGRQLVNHGHFTVDGKKVDIPSFQVKPNQTIAIREKSQKSKVFEGLADKLAKLELPSWLSVDATKLTGRILNKPKPEDTKVNFDIKKIIEFYSR